jgi:hypothetical protein
MTLARVRALSGTSIASPFNKIGNGNFVDPRFRGPIQRALHMQQGFVVGQTDAVFQPVMDFGRGKSPFAAHPPPGQLAALRQLHYRRWHHVQVRSESVDVEVVLGHECIVAWMVGASRHIEQSTENGKANEKHVGLEARSATILCKRWRSMHVCPVGTSDNSPAI